MSRKILFVSDDFLPAKTGVGVYLGSVCQKLSDHGWDITVLTTRRRGHPEGMKTSKGGVKILRVPTIVMADFPQGVLFSPSARHILKMVQPDIVHIQYLSLMSLSMAYECHKRGIPMIFTYHFAPEVLTQPFFMKPFRPWVVRKLGQVLRMMDRVIVPTRHVFQNIVSNDDGVDKDRVVLITNPMPFSSVATGQPLVKTVGQFDILYAGRLAPEKILPI